MATLGLKWRHEFQSTYGKRYRLDISQRDFTGSSSTLALGGSPVVTTGTRGDIWSTFKGKRMNVSLRVNATTTYDNFEEAEYREYFAGLYFEDPNNAGSYLPEFEGWLIPQGIVTPQQAPPYNIQLIFYDGLAALQEARVAAATSSDERSLYSYVTEALNATGLNYNIKRNTGITVSGTAGNEALSNTTIDPFWGYDDDRVTRRPLKRVVDEICQWSNQRVFQGNGDWVMTNNSIYGGVLTPTSVGRDFDLSRISGADSISSPNVASSVTAWPDFTAIGESVLTQNIQFFQNTQTGDEILIVEDDDNWGLFQVTGEISASGITGDRIQLVVMRFAGTFSGDPLSITVYRDSNGVNVRDATSLPDQNEPTETVNFLVTDDDGIAQSPESAQVLQLVGSGRDLVPVEQPIRTSTEPADTTVQYNVTTQEPKPYLANDSFELGTQGWTLDNGTIDTENFFKGTQSLASTEFSIPTGIPPFLTSTGITFNPIQQGLNLNFKYLFTNRPSSATTNVVRFRLRLSGVTYQEYWYGQTGDPTQQEIQNLYYVKNLGWVTGNNSNTWNRIDSDSFDEWREFSLEVPPAVYWKYGDPPYTLTLEILKPSLLDSDGDTLSSVGTAQFNLDDIILTPLLDMDAYDPVFERVQQGGNNTTNEYESSIVSFGDLNFFIGNTSNGSFGSNGSTGSMEELVTQQRLNDVGTNLVVYTGTLLSKLDTPLTLENKLRLDDIDDTPVIIDSLEHNVFSEQWNFSAHQVKQNTNVPSVFVDRDVEILRTNFPDRGLINFTVNAVGRGVDDQGDEILVAGVNALSIEPALLEFSGEPGQISTQEIAINVAQPYSAEASDITLLDSGTITAPEGMEILRLWKPPGSTGLRSVVGYTLPYTNIGSSTATFGGEINVLSTTAIDVTIDISIIDSDGNVAISQIPLRGEPGNSRTFNVIVTPNTGRQLVTNGFAYTLGTGLTHAGLSLSGSGLEWNISYEFPDVAPMVNPTAQITAVEDIAAGTSDSATFTLNFLEPSSGINNLSFASTSFPITGPPGSPYTHFRRANPAEGYIATAGNDDTMSSDNTNAAVQDAVQDGNGYLIPITGTIPVGGGSANITLGYTGEVVRVGADTVDTVVNFITTQLLNASTDENSSETYTSIRDSNGNNTIRLIPSEGRRYLNASDVTTTFAGNVQEISKVLEKDGSISVRYQVAFGDSDSLTGNSITFSGNSSVEPFRFIATHDITGLSNSSVNWPSVNQPFSVSDAGTTFARTYQVGGVGNFAYTSTDVLTISSGSNVATSTPTFSGGIWTFTATFTYPASDSDFYKDPHEFYTSLTIAGTPSATTPDDSRTEVILQFVDSITNGAPSVPSVTLSGDPGTTATYHAVAFPDAGYRIPAMNLTTTDSSAITTIGTDTTRGFTSVVPIEVTFPTAATTTISVTMTGTALAVGVAPTTYVLTVDASGDNFTIPDFSTPTTFEGTGADVISNIFIQSDAGHAITSVSSIVAPTGVTVGALSIAGDGAILPITVDTEAADSGTITFTVNSEDEPNTLTVIIREELPQGKLQQSTFQTRFGPNDYNTTHDFGNIVIQPTEGVMEYPSDQTVTLPTVSGLTFGTVTGSNGNLLIPLSAAIGNDQDSDLTYEATITTGAPRHIPAQTASLRSLTDGISSAGGSAVFELTTNGRFNASIQVASNGDSAGTNSDDGNFTLTSNNGLLSSTGSYTPTTGEAGTTQIVLQVGQEPFYLNPAGNTGLSASYYNSLSLTIRIHSRNPDGSDGTLLASASVTQSHAFGGREFDVPSTWTTSEVENANFSTVKNSWTFWTQQ